jgi:hypothetical protein
MTTTTTFDGTGSLAEVCCVSFNLVWKIPDKRSKKHEQIHL